MAEFSPKKKVDARFYPGAVGTAEGGIAGVRGEVPVGPVRVSVGATQPYYTAEKRPHRAGEAYKFVRVEGQLPLTKRQRALAAEQPKLAESEKDSIAARRLIAALEK